MSEKRFSAEELTMFIRDLYQWSTPATNRTVRKAYKEQTGYEERTFRDKILPSAKRAFSGQELQTIIRIYQEVLGADYQERFEEFIQKMSDADSRPEMEKPEPATPVKTTRYDPINTSTKQLRQKWDSMKEPVKQSA